MKKFWLTGVALSTLIAGSAMAADLAVRRPLPPPVPVLSWTGFYVGLNAGGGWDNNGVNETVTSEFCNATLGGCAPDAFGLAAAAAVPPVFNVKSSGFIGGGQLGYNYQTGAVVWGVEADFQGASIKGSNAQAGTVVPTGFGGIGSTVTVAGLADKKLDFLGTLRGRVGVTPVAPLLLYVTGGLAYGHIKSSTTLTETVGGPCFCGPSPSAFGSISTTRAGWSAGAGGEWAFSPQASVKVEWLHYDLGTSSYALSPLTQLNGAAVPFFGVTTQSSTRFRGDIVRAGVNWRFGGPVYAAY